MPRARSITPPSSAVALAEEEAPKGRNIPAQGNALGYRHPTNPSPEGAAQGWRIAKISDFAKTTSGGTPSRANPQFYTGNIPWIKSGDLNDGNVSEATEFITEEALKNSSAKLFPAGTLMIALYGATIGKLGILTIEAATNQAVCGIFVPKEVDTKFLFYYLLHKRPELVEQGAGGAQPNISQGIIRDIEVPLPPLPEQRRIVARIEELFSRLEAGVAALRYAKAQLQRYRQSVLAAAVTGQLTRAWREQHPETEPTAASVTVEGVGGMSGVLDQWKVAKISEFAKTTSGGTPSRKKPEFYTGDIPWIKSGDLNDGMVSEPTEFITEDALKNSSAKMFPSGTMMIALYGATIGKLGVLTIEAATNQAVCGIFVPKEVETKYLFYFLLQHRRELIELGAGGAQPNISQGIIRDVKVPLPTLPEQRQIVAEIEARFTVVDHLEAELDRQINRSIRLRQSALASAFKGEL